MALDTLTSLKELDEKYLALERQYEKECQEIVKRFQLQYSPILEKRKEILLRRPPGVEGITSGGTPAIEGFWLKAMQKHPVFEDVIQEYDEPVLKFLVDMQHNLKNTEDSYEGFEIKFHFAENPYFTNECLTKVYTTKEASPWNGEIDILGVECSKIDWKAGMNVTFRKSTKKIKGGGAKKNKQKAKEREESQPSFFRDFMRNIKRGEEPNKVVIDQLKSLQDGIEDVETLVEFFLETDYEIGVAVRDNLIPYAVRWYTGEAIPEDDEEGEEEEEEDEDEEESDDETPKKNPKKKAESKHAKAAGSGEAQQECQQQ